ncbi:hypothetical protein E2K93_12485 [Thalassotalea sp. HSM 43]|uniref:hypothetical protein n=1 Tax=Thalassotalea sp. HSM 43 TaxID=2552945 RepID=UPI00108044A7|nr:hypothetical protein [Thalassotalea sp. HSM 43]QBY05150.1 hypothetical protein E2K93_12485 [Thalassotalea sp. HSM 43]
MSTTNQWHNWITDVFGTMPIDIQAGFTTNYIGNIKRTTTALVTLVESNAVDTTAITQYKQQLREKAIVFSECKTWFQSNSKNSGLTFTDKNSNSTFSKILDSIASALMSEADHLSKIYS